MPGADMAEPRIAPRWQRWGRTALRLALVIVVAYGLHLALTAVMEQTGALHDSAAGVRLGLLLLMLVAYAVLLAVPFVPGVEIGIALLAMEGSWIAPFVYVATILGLMLAFLLGRHLPYRILHRAFADLGMERACRLLETIEPLPPARRLEMLRRRLPERLAPHAVRWRYLILAGLFNLPGSAILGGGGGIALIAGLSRLFDTRATLLTVVLAVAPVPATVWLFGMDALL